MQRYRPINHEPWDRRLDRLIPDDFTHVEKWPLTAETTPAGPTPVVIGINWYENFDRPQQDSSGRWWIGRGPLGQIRGGHCVCLAPGQLRDLTSWWDFYNQLREGKCVGEGISRMMSLLNRKRYDPTWLWNEAKKIDEWPETNPGDDNGTSVRAGLDVLRTRGHVPWNHRGGYPLIEEGISANRWARSVDEVHKVLQNGVADRLGAVPPLNSWGRDYPHVVYMPDETFDRLIREDGEIGLVVDR